MKALSGTAFTFILLFSFCQAAFENWGQTALTDGLGQEGVTLTSEAAGFSYNPAATGFLGKGTVQFGYCRLFGLADLGVNDFYLVFPAGRLNCGVGVSVFGNEDYREMISALSLAYKTGDSFSFGMNVKYMKTSFNSRYGDLSALGLDGGVVFKPNEKMDFGFALRNFNQPDLGDGSDDIPFIWAAGAKIAPFDNFKLCFSLSGEERFKATAHMGQEIKVAPNLALRMGMASQPIAYGLGVGTNLARFHMDYSFLEHPVLGGTHRFDLSFSFKN